MVERIDKAIIKFFHDISIAELKIHNSSTCHSKISFNSKMYIDIINANQGKYTVSKIANMLGVAKPSVTQKINELEALGYIEKRQSETDKRKFYLYSTKKALPEYVDSVYQNINKEIEKELIQKYTKEEIDTFFEIINLVGEISKNY